MPITVEHDGLLSNSFTKCDPMVPDAPMTRALNGLGSNFIKRL